MVYQPVDYVSHVTAIGNDGRSQALTVRVNHPVDIDKTLYYQASYGFGVRFDVTHNGRPDVERSSRTLLEGDSIEFPDGRTLLYERFVPTWIAGPDCRPPTRASTTRRRFCKP